jgi:hypothetical protein
LLKIDVERAKLELFTSGYVPWLSRTRNLAIELHDPDCEQVFLRAMAGYDYASSQEKRGSAETSVYGPKSRQGDGRRSFASGYADYDAAKSKRAGRRVFHHPRGRFVQHRPSKVVDAASSPNARSTRADQGGSAPMNFSSNTAPILSSRPASADRQGAWPWSGIAGAVQLGRWRASTTAFWKHRSTDTDGGVIYINMPMLDRRHAAGWRKARI